jgi:hypothetical protein
MIFKQKRQFTIMHDHYNYTKDEIKKNLVLLEAHGKNNPCPDCIDKHLIAIEGLSEEGVLMTENPDERQKFLDMAEWARRARKELNLKDMT